jgi:hypothetical protein
MSDHERGMLLFVVRRQPRSSGPTNVSKNAHVRRASFRRKAMSSVSRFASRRGSGRLTHHAMAGETSHSSRIGAAAASEGMAAAMSTTPVTAAIAGPIHMDPTDPKRPLRRLALPAPRSGSSMADGIPLEQVAMLSRASATPCGRWHRR